jgi:two-component system chemotaxis response regulator CheB
VTSRDIIVIGASSGGLDALNGVISRLPPDLRAAVFIVWHMSPDSPGLLPEILSRAGKLPAIHPKDQGQIEPGRIYVAVPDHHLLIEPGRVRVTRGPKENRFRPAIDPLFRSAAQVYGPSVIGVVLSGNLDDGTAGLLAVKQRGGLAIVQDPHEATYPSMPRSAMEKVDIDYCLAAQEIGTKLGHLVSQSVVDKGVLPVTDRMKIETQIAKGDNALEAGVMSLGSPSTFTCPECHGVLVMLQEQGLVRFRCHTGHAFSQGALLAGIAESMEESLWSVLRVMDECTMLTRHIGEHLQENGQHEQAKLFFKKTRESEQRASAIRQLLQGQDNFGEELNRREN